MSGRDRRKYPRLEGRFQVDVLNMGDDPNIAAWESLVEAEALDVSMQGMRIKSSYDVSVGDLISVVFYYRNHESVCLCDVVWKRSLMGEFVYGLYLKEWSKLDHALSSKLQSMEQAAL